MASMGTFTISLRWFRMIKLRFVTETTVTKITLLSILTRVHEEFIKEDTSSGIPASKEIRFCLFAMEIS